jgi:hypothetical protein
MKNTKIRNIWSYDENKELGTDEEIKEQHKEFLEINGLSLELAEDENEHYEYINMTLQEYLDDVQTEIEFHENAHGMKTYLIIANLGLWFGNRRGGKVVKGLWNAISSTLEDYNTIYQEGRTLKVDAIHHDGTNNFEIYELTEKGEEWYNRNNDWRSREDICETLYNNKKYRRNVQFFNNLYGWLKPTGGIHSEIN